MRTAFPAVVILGALLAGTACRKTDPAEFVRRGNTAFEQARYNEAIIEYRRALQLNERLGETREKLGDAYAHINDPVNAVREYIRAGDLLPNDPEAQIKAGNGLLLARRFEEARSRAQKVLANDPKNVRAHILRGNAMAGLKDFDGAILDYENAVAADPSQRGAFENLGTIQMLRGNAQEAETAFEKAVEVAPQSVDARLALANFYWAARRQGDAESTLKAAFEIDPKSVEANRALGAFYIATGRASEAEPYFKTLASTVATPAAQASLAQYYVIANRRDDARRVLTELSQQKGGQAIATIRLAALDAAEGQRAQAEERLRTFLAANPREINAHLLYATILLRDQKRDEAAEAVKAALALDANSIVAHAVQAQINAQNDRLEAAIAEYEKVLALDGRSLQAQLALAQFHLTLGHTEKSTFYAQQALANAPTSPVAQDLLVRNLLAHGDIAKADGIVKQLTTNYPGAPEPLNLAALVQLFRRDSVAAHASYARVLELDATNIEALIGIVRLELAAQKRQTAVDRLDAAATTARPSGDLLLAIARGYSMAQEPQKSEAVLKRAIELEPSRLQGYNMLGQLYAREHRLDDASAEFERSLKREPSSIPARTMIGMIREAQGLLNEAEKSYESVLAVDAKAAVAANNLAWLYVSSGRKLDEAQRLAQMAYEQLADEPDVADTLGWILVKKDFSGRAVAILETAAKAFPERPEFRYHLGVAYYKTGDWKKSRTELEKALSLNKTLDWADDARKTLAIIGGASSN